MTGMIRSVALACGVLIAALAAYTMYRRSQLDDLTSRPALGALPDSLPELDSRLVLSTKLSFARLAERLDAGLPQRLHQIDEDVHHRDRILGIRYSVGAKLTGAVTRRGPINVEGDNGEILITIPVRAQATARPGDDEIWRIFGLRETAVSDLDVRVRVSPRIDSTWIPAVGVKADFKYVQRPTVMLFGLFPLTFGSSLEGDLRKMLNDGASDVEAALTATDFEARLDSVWAELVSRPIPIVERPPAWVVLRPRTAAFSGFSTDESGLSATVEVIFGARASLGSRPTVRPLPRPPLTTLTGNEQTSALRLPVVLPYTNIAEELTRAAAKDSFVLKQGSRRTVVRIREVDLFATQSKLALAVRFEADAHGLLDTQGRFYLEGMPVIDADISELRVSDLAFTSSTNSLAVDAAVTLATLAPLRLYLQSLLRTNFERHIRDALTRANESLAFPTSSDAALTGTVTGLRVAAIDLTQTAVVLTITADARLVVLMGH